MLKINVTAHELLDRKALVAAALSAHVSLLAAHHARNRSADSIHSERRATCRDRLIARLSELHAAQEARTLVEERCIEGHPALIPELSKAWLEQRADSETIADMAVRLAGFDGVPQSRPQTRGHIPQDG